jgi:Amiloride-sensitive sodium channel
MIRQSDIKTAKQKFWHIARYHHFQYLKSSTVHGVKYIAEKDRSWTERVWWILVIIVSFLGCGKLISDAWNINPIIISFTDKPTPIWQVSCQRIEQYSYSLIV